MKLLESSSKRSLIMSGYTNCSLALMFNFRCTFCASRYHFVNSLESLIT